MSLWLVLVKWQQVYLILIMVVVLRQKRCSFCKRYQTRTGKIINNQDQENCRGTQIFTASQVVCAGEPSLESDSEWLSLTYIFLVSAGARVTGGSSHGSWAGAE